MSVQVRSVLGIVLLVLGLIMPCGMATVEGTNWPGVVKVGVGSALLFGLEILSIPAVALMGKEGYARIVRRFTPAGSVGRLRYAIGLALFLGPMLIGYVVAYIPSAMPAEYSARLWVNTGLDLMVLASLFVLGGDFWDKLRALFVWDARAVFPSPLAFEQVQPE